MKEKIGIEKLIELLNEYSVKEKFGIIWKIGDDPTGIYGYVNDMYGLGWASDLVICSARYGFIKWLVENDKIDFEGMSGHGKIISYLTDEKDYKWNDIKEGVVLMLLSISDTPIEDLISYLK